MTVIVTHNKVSAVADSGDTTLVQPSDWNANHTISGLGTAASLDAGVANGVATLDSSGKVPTSQIPLQGDLNYQGAWNASTNTPTLTSSVGTKGYYYVVSVAGTTNLDGITDWQIGDWAIFNGSVWQKVDNTDAVTSVNGYTGTVVLTQPDISGTVPTSRTISTTSPLTGGGDLSANRTLAITQASGSASGYLSSTDWNTFNNKANSGANSNITSLSGITGSISSPTYIHFDTTYATALTAGQLGWDGNNTLAIGMAGGNVTQHIGEDLYFYFKATSAVTKGQVVMFTGAVGASGVPTGAPATGVTDGTYIMGIAAESVALNGFGLVQAFGELRNINTTGYADGDILWYDPSVTGGLTKTKPSAPNVKVQMAAVINGGSSGGGTILIRIDPGSTLGGTDSNAQITSPSNGQILTYDGTNTYWKNTTVASGTGISVSSSATGVMTITNTSPDQTVAISAGTGISVSGTYPSFTVTNSGVTSIAGTASQITASASTGGVTLALANPINVDTSGNAATVTNGVYTTGSYANPTWITSLAGSKISGTIDGGTF
jgi:hypothetical protein